VNRGAALVLAALSFVSVSLSAQTVGAWRADAVGSFDEVWQTVADTFYDASFGGIDWPAVRAELRPRAQAAATPSEVRVVIREMLARLGRSHFVLLSEADAAQRADTRLTIADGPVLQFSNLPPIAVRTDIREARTPSGRPIGVIGFNYWMTPIADPVAEAVDRFRNADGLVFDLRGNPGGLATMISGTAGHIIAQPLLLGRMRTRDAELEFRVNPRVTTSDGRRVQPFSGRVALLVDEQTASTSECFAGALQDLGRARVFGRRTMGQALPSLTKRLPTGDVLVYAIGTFLTPSGRILEGEGVQPDELISIPAGALPAGEDQVLGAALRWFDLPGPRGRR
jgi:carboxyl-terminal processing protease